VQYLFYFSALNQLLLIFNLNKLPHAVFTQLTPFFLLAVLVISTRSVQAQGVVADQTLPNSSVVTATENSFVITGGTVADRNLFHSFQEFSVPTNGRASFQGVDARITNVFSRVTGTASSRIDGVIEIQQANGTISSANLFLLNPHGIIFGSNASLNIGGSFVATTGDRIQFADNIQFSANPAQSSPLLTVTTPTGIQFGRNPGAIINQSRANVGFNELGTPITGGLQVPNGQTLALVGGDIAFQGGIAVADSGRVELGSLAGQEQVNLRSTQTGWRLEYDAQNFGDIRLTNGAGIGGLSGSAIALYGRQIALVDDSRIVAETNTQTGALNRLHATEFAVFNSSLFGSRTTGDGNAGSLRVTTPRLLLQNRSAIASQTYGNGQSGNVQIRTTRLDIRGGASLGTSTLGNGQGGNVLIQASEGISLTAEPLSVVSGASSQGEDPSQIFTVAGETATNRAEAGRLTLITPRLTLQNGAQINAATFGAADAGELTVRANTIELTGVRLDSEDKPFFDQDGFTRGSGLFTQSNRSQSGNTLRSGNGGILTVHTQQLIIRDGAGIATNTYSSGNAGNIQIRASDFVQISGSARRGDRAIPSGLYSTAGGNQRISATYPDATGRGGTIRISTPELQVLDGGFIGVGSSSTVPSSPGAGQIIVRSPLIELEDGNLNAETEFGNLASIRLRDVDFLTLRNGSRITTSAGLQSGSGTGGNITIDADFIITIPDENSDVTANAYSGSGGRVEITTQRLFGIDPLSREALQTQLATTQPEQLDPANLPSNDITAISQVNPSLNGQVNLNTPDVDPSRGLAELPADVVDASQQIARGCGTGNRTVADEQGRFVVTGRGGLPANPTAPLSSDTVLGGWVSSTMETEATDSTSYISPEPATFEPIVEAQSWIVDPQGEVVLVANAQSVLPNHSTTSSSLTCQ
jgi:filamentous hemagglutinin family protein